MKMEELSESDLPGSSGGRHVSVERSSHTHTQSILHGIQTQWARACLCLCGSYNPTGRLKISPPVKLTFDEHRQNY